MPAPTSADEVAVREALRGVVDPELGDNIVDLGMVRRVEVDRGSVTIEVALTIAACPLRTQLRDEIVRRVDAVPGVSTVVIEMGAMSQDERTALMARARWRAREHAPPTAIAANTRVLAIGSGKGGVGKSSVTANLAVALAHRGLRVGVLDADIAGFSIPQLLGVEERLDASNGKIEPFERALGPGLLRVVSMGLIEGSAAEAAVMLRGLMLNRALQHFLEDVHWGELDYLLIDMPPGTSDVAMGLARMLPRADMLVVTTPALAAQQVAARAVDMARRGYLRVAGIVENMSPYVGSDGRVHAVFGSGGGERLATKTDTPLLACIPLDETVASSADDGRTTVEANPDGPAARALVDLATVISETVSPVVEMSGCTSRLLDAVAAALDAK